jgi:homoserine dehydrogenase
LIEQVIANRVRHADWLNLHLEYVALADSDGAVVNSGGLNDGALTEIVEAKAGGRRLNELDAGYVQRDLAAIVDVAGADQAIVIDVTATEDTIPALLDALKRGYRVVTANKRPLTNSFALFQRLTAGRRIRFETTVGAALPVISTLQTLVDTGDEVRHIQGCLSGTLGFICAQLEAGKPFSEAIREAKRRGYTEPDPREDLAGSDAARKALIMARMLGHPIEFGDVEIERLYPPAMDNLSVDEFLAQVDVLDEPFAARAAEAKAAGWPLRYVSEVVDGRCHVSMSTVEPDSRLAHIQASDSIVVFRTARYQDNPLVISGRGAGPVVTASGVLGDILALAL